MLTRPGEPIARTGAKVPGEDGPERPRGGGRSDAARDAAVILALADVTRAVEVAALLEGVVGAVEVHDAASIAAVIGAVRRRPAAVVILDYACERGRDLLTRLRGHHGVATLVIAEEVDLEVAIAGGADDLLLAPWTPAGLASQALITSTRLLRGCTRGPSELDPWARSTGDPLLVMDVDLCVLASNAAADALLQLEPGAAIGAPLSVLLGGDGAAQRRLLEALGRARSGERLGGVVLMRGDGDPLPCDLHVSRWRGEGGARFGVRIAGSRGQALADELARIASFPELNPTPIFELGAEGALLYRNRSFQTLPEPVQRDLLTDARRPLRSGRLADHAVVTRELPCGDHWFHATVHLTREWASVRVYARDITERRAAERLLTEALESLDRKVRERTADLRREVEIRAQAEEAALAASRTKSAFLAMMSHELRTPLSAIIGFAELLHEDAEDAEDPQVAADLGKIIGAAHHLLGLINDILDLSKIEAGRMDVHLEPVDLAGELAGVAEAAAPLVAARGNTLTVAVDPTLGELGELESDRQRLRQILDNLVGNAAKFTCGGALELRARRVDDGGVEIAVADNGIGIAADKLHAIFEPFTQADGSTAREFGGTGLGLTISRRLAELLGGSIAVASELGVGSTFTLRLPARGAPQPATQR